MIRILYITLILIITIQAQTKIETDSKTDPPMLVGRGVKSDILKAPFLEWYQENSKSYEADHGLVQATSDFINGVTIEIFMGTWCGDSRREVPRFLDIIEEAGYESEIQAIAYLNRDRVNPQGDEKGKNIHHVPTFIIYRDGIELGRIVESPVESLEDDLFNILMGDPPTPNYSDWEEE